MIPFVIQNLVQKLQISFLSKKRIIFPKGNSLLVQKIANDSVSKGLGNCFLVFNNSKEVPQNINFQIHLLIIEQFDLNELTLQLFKLQKEKITLQQSKVLVQQRNYFAMMMVKINKVDCFLGGIDCSTVAVLRPTFQIIKTKKTVATVTSAFSIIKKNHNFLFADCALTVSPTVFDLVNITKNSINLADEFGFKKEKIAMLLFSTADSSVNDSIVDKIKEATTILNSELPKPHIVLDEVSFDAVFSKLIWKNKWKFQIHNFSDPANIFVFPDLNSANIDYKIAQHFDSYTAIYPIITGLNFPNRGYKGGHLLHSNYYP